MKKRLSRDLKLTVLELSPSKKGEPALQIQEETQRVLEALSKMNGQKWLLDEAGQTLDSEGFSDVLTQFSDRGESLTLVIGGAFGFTEEVKNVCTRTVALSSMTLTHELAQLLILEQLFRAISIRKNTGYHHGKNPF